MEKEIIAKENEIDKIDTIDFPNPEFPVFVEFQEINQDYRNSSARSYCVDEILMIIVNNGSVRVDTEGKSITVSSGEGLIMNSRVRHKYRLASVESCGYYALAFDLKFLFPTEYMYEKYASPIVNDKSLPFIKFTENTIRDEALLDGFNKVIVTNLLKKSNFEPLTLSLLTGLWVALLEYAGENNTMHNGKNFPTSDERRVEAASNFISENYQDMLALEDIADHIHLSNSECCRCFKRVLGKSPMNYLMEYRVFAAVRILYKNPEAADSIGDLCFIVGFNNPSYFIKIFRRYTGVTPTGYKKLLKSDLTRAERIYVNLQEEISVL